MNILKRSAIVAYSTRQMFELVNNIEDYPRFLPWCESSLIHSRSDTEVIATLEIAWKGIRKQFTTRNVLYPDSRMEMFLVKGPLQHLQGVWHFIALNESGCKVTLDLEFEFTGSFIDKLFQPIFRNIADTLVDSFCKRAVELYGQN